MKTAPQPPAGPGERRAYRMTTRARAIEQTREAILLATYQLWLERPYDELTIEAVADRAGVSRQTVHRQFGAKDELVVATAAWRAPREESERAVEPGDVAAAVERVVQRNEEMGDANIRALELEGRVDAINGMLAEGRRAHRRWVEHSFGPYLPADPAARRRTVDGLFAATDVTVWKVLRRDLGRSAPATAAVIRQLVDGVLTPRDRPDRDGES